MISFKGDCVTSSPKPLNSSCKNLVISTYDELNDRHEEPLKIVQYKVDFEPLVYITATSSRSDTDIDSLEASNTDETIEFRTATKESSRTLLKIQLSKDSMGQLCPKLLHNQMQSQQQPDQLQRARREQQEPGRQTDVFRTPPIQMRVPETETYRTKPPKRSTLSKRTTIKRVEIDVRSDSPRLVDRRIGWDQRMDKEKVLARLAKLYLEKERIPPAEKFVTARNRRNEKGSPKTENAVPLKSISRCESASSICGLSRTRPKKISINPVPLSRVQVSPKVKPLQLSYPKSEEKVEFCMFQSQKEKSKVIEPSTDKTVIFCRNSQDICPAPNQSVIGLCDDCFVRTQRAMDPGATGPRRGLFEDQARGTNENGEECFPKGFRPDDLEPFCTLVNCHLLKLHSVDGDLLKDSVKVLQEKWLKLVIDKNTSRKNFRKCFEYFRQFSDNLAHTIIHSIDKERNNTLHLALGNNRFDFVEEIIRNGCLPELILKKNRSGHSPVMICSISKPKTEDDWKIVEKVIKMANVNEKTFLSEQTALMNAASRGYDRMVELLLGAGALPDLQDKDGSTALMYAAEHGHLACVRVLLQAPADPSLKDRDDQTAISIALAAGHKDVAMQIYVQSKIRSGERAINSI